MVTPYVSGISGLTLVKEARLLFLKALLSQVLTTLKQVVFFQATLAEVEII